MIKQPRSIPHTPGVYIFYRRNTPIYIGKAAHLKKRLISYWRKNAGQKVAHLLSEATGIKWIETASEVDALLKEASLIKQHVPKYNIVMRDDKNYFYIGATKEKFPKIFLTHQSQSYETGSHKIDSMQYIGPFTSGSALKSTMRLLRRIFPYCTCKKPHKRPCLNAQISRCPGYCCIKGEGENVPSRQRPLSTWNIQYRDNIRHIIAVLSGKKRKLLLHLKREMCEAAHSENFERAAGLRDQIAGLENIFSHQSLLLRAPEKQPRIIWYRIERTIKELLQTKHKISRVEGYDISNIFGTEATGSMVVFINGYPVKSEYRKFHIKTVRGISDVDMHKEVMRRRLGHPEWPYPDLVVIDGGKPQLNAAQTALRSKIPDSQFKILLTALAKREEELYIEGKKKPMRLDSLPPPTKFFFQHVRDESHRFAKKYHHKLREIYYRAPQQNI